VVFVSGVPLLTLDMGDAARRFAWLVDVFYDHRVKLLLSAAVPAEELYREGPNSQEFPRTASRLIEMRTREYMALPHQAGTPVATTAP
jgi:cell division protein ZapE